MSNVNFVGNKWRLAAVALAITLITLSSFVALYQVPAGVSQTPAFLDVSIVGPDKLGANTPTTFTASVANSYSGKLEYTWSISPQNDNTFLEPDGASCTLTFVVATEEPYVLSVQARDLVVGNLGSASKTVHDPYTSPNLYLGAYGAPYSYLIETDGLGWYRAINGSTGRVEWSSTNQSSVIQSTINGLTVGRTTKERIVLQGNLGDVSNVVLASYLILEGQKCTINLPLTANTIFKATSDITDIEVTGITFTATYGDRAAVNSEANAIKAYDGSNYKTITNALISKCNFTEFVISDAVTGRGIFAIMRNSLIEKCTFSSTNALAFGSTQICLYIGSKNVVISENNFIQNMYGNTIYTTGSSDIKIVDNDFLESNYVHNNDGVETRNSTRFIISGNTFRDNSFTGIYIRGDNETDQNTQFTISDNIFINVGSEGKEGSAIRIYSPVGYENQGMKIENNKFINSWIGVRVGLGTDDAGIDHQVDITDNDFFDCTHAVAVYSPSNIIRILNNYINNNAGHNTTGAHYVHYSIPNLVMRGNEGLNPYGTLAYPFDNTANYVGWCEGNAGPVANRNYTVVGMDIMIDIAGGTGVDICIRDSAGNLIANPGATARGLIVPVGYIINFGNFSVDPTTIIVGGV